MTLPNYNNLLLDNIYVKFILNNMYSKYINFSNSNIVFGLSACPCHDLE